MSEIHNPHDKLVKKLLQDKQIAQAFFQKHLPARTLQKLDLDSLRSTSESAITPEWKELRNDIVFTCQTKKGKKGHCRNNKIEDILLMQ